MPERKESEFGVRAIGVKTLSPSQLRANPHNPRTLFDRDDLHILRESISRVGILVPLTVYQEKKSRHYRHSRRPTTLDVRSGSWTRDDSRQ